MNKNTKKIILLTVAAILAIVGVLYFYKTIVSPPEELKFTQNRHLESIEAKINTIDGRHVGYQNDSLYDAVSDVIKLCEGEGYITTTEKESVMKFFMQKYIPLYNNWCYSRFRESIWHEEEHSYMKHRNAELMNLSSASSFSNDLQAINKIINNYENANRLSAKYNGIDKARKTINEAKNYKQMEYLSNCTALISKLNAVPKNIEASHYAYLTSLKNNLWKFKSEEWDEDTFDDKYNSFSNEVNKYEDNKSIYGQHARSLQSLKEDAKEIRKTAKSYYAGDSEYNI